MKALPAALETALAQRLTVPRDFVWFTVRDRDTGVAHSEGYWSDEGTISASVYDVAAGGNVTRTYTGAGGLIGISPIPLVSGLSSQTVTITLAGVSDRIETLIRGYEPRHGRIQIHRGLLHHETRVLVAPAQPRFLGWIDGVPLEAEGEGGETLVKVKCVSDSRELGRGNPATRSDADQRLRSATDNFFQDVSTIGQLEVFWGTKEAT